MFVNGILKLWKYFDCVLFNSEIFYIVDYVKIVCVFMNGYWLEFVIKDVVMEK